MMPVKLAAFHKNHRLLARSILVALITLLSFVLYVAADRGTGAEVLSLLGVTVLVMLAVVLFD